MGGDPLGYSAAIDEWEPITPPSSYGLLGLILTVSAWTNILFLLGFMRKHLDFLEQYLSGNKRVINTISLWGG